MFRNSLDPDPYSDFWLDPDSMNMDPNYCVGVSKACRGWPSEPLLQEPPQVWRLSWRSCSHSWLRTNICWGEVLKKQWSGSGFFRYPDPDSKTRNRIHPYYLLQCFKKYHQELIPVGTNFYNFFLFRYLYSPPRPRVLYFICTVLQCDLPPLRPHCGEARAENRTRDGRSRGKDSNHQTTTPP